MHDMLTWWLATDWLPKFKKEKAMTYRMIVREFAKIEIMSSKNQS